MLHAQSDWEETRLVAGFGVSDTSKLLMSFTSLSVFIFLKRRSMGYVRRYLSVMALLSLIALLPLFAKPAIGTNSILSYELGLLFASVGYVFVTSNLLPPTPERTIMDRYTGFMLSFIFGIMIDMTIASRIANLDGTETLPSPEAHGFAFVAAWVLSQIYYYVVYVRPAMKMLMDEIPVRATLGIQECHILVELPLRDNLEAEKSRSRWPFAATKRGGWGKVCLRSMNKL